MAQRFALEHGLAQVRLVPSRGGRAAEAQGFEADLRLETRLCSLQVRIILPAEESLPASVSQPVRHQQQPVYMVLRMEADMQINNQQAGL